MKLTEQGVGEVTLTDKDFIAKGGEKSVYGKGNTAYCVFHDPSRMIPDGKFKELATLDDPRLMKPRGLLLDRKQRKVGFTTHFIKDAVALCEVFTKAYKKRSGLEADDILRLVKQFRELIGHVHSRNILVVDLNEFNFLADQKHTNVYGIDVNSYQTTHYPATAIMESIRDRHCNRIWTPETDWFSWGVVTFQMLIGIHPYKGNHPKYQHLGLADAMEAQMQANCSVFDPKTKVPKVCEPLDVIPSALKQWYRAIFEDGKRVAPPADFQTVAAIVTAKIKKVTGSDNFVIEKIFEAADEILGVYVSGPTRVVTTTRHIYVNDRATRLPQPGVRIGFTSKMARPVAAYVENSTIHLWNVAEEEEIPIVTKADAVTTCEDRLLVKSGPYIVEVIFTEIGDSIIASVKEVGRVLPQATKLYDGVAIQNLLGTYVASIFPHSGHCEQIELPELEKYKIVDAKYENKVLVVVAANDGKYDRFVFRFSSNFKEYTARVVEDITPLGINFTVGDNGVVVLINEDECVEAFQNNRNATQVKVFSPDPSVDGDVRLFHDGATMLFSKGNALYSIRMKK